MGILTEKRRGVHPRIVHTPEAAKDFLERIEASPKLREMREKHVREQLEKAEELKSRELVKFEGLTNLNPACGQIGEISGTFGDLYLLGRCDAEGIRRVREAALHISEYPVWCEPGILYRRFAWHSDLQTCMLVNSMSTIYDQFYEEFSEKERKTIRDALFSKGILPLLDDWINPGTRIHALDTMGHNWWAVCIAGAIIGLCAIYDEIDDGIPMIEDALRALREFMGYKGQPALGRTANFDESGMFWEGALYFNYGIGELCHGLAVMKNCFDDGGFMTAHPLWKKIPKAFMSMAYPTSKSDLEYLFADFGDSHMWIGGCSPMATCMLEAGIGDEDFKRFFNMAHGKPGIMDLKNPDLFEWDGKAPKLPTVFLSEGAGLCTVRSSGSKDANMLSVRCGYSWNHAHADAGSFILFHGGECVISDSATTTYGRKEYMGYYVQSQAHNMILVNGKGMPGWNVSRGNRLPGKIRELVRDGRTVSFIADATGPRSDQCFRDLRTFIKVDDSLFVIVDDMTAYKESAFDFLLHYRGDVRCSGNRMKIKTGDTVTYVDTMVPYDIRRKKKEIDGTKYMSIRVGKKTMKLQMMSVISFEDSETTSQLISDDNILGCVITKDGVEHRIFYNRAADSQLAHENSINRIGGYLTDSYIFADLFNGAKKLCILGSFLRKDGKSYLEEWVKTTRFLK